MKVEAYRCEICLRVFDSNECSGIHYDNQGDIFTREHDIKFTLETNNNKSSAHFCMNCYTIQVDEPAQAVKRNHDQDEYTIHYKTLQRNFFLLVYRRYETNRHKAAAKGEHYMANRKRSK